MPRQLTRPPLGSNTDLDGVLDIEPRASGSPALAPQKGPAEVTLICLCQAESFLDATLAYQLLDLVRDVLKSHPLWKLKRQMSRK